MSERFLNRVIVVTGGSAGIGKATAFAFARERAKVVIADIDAEGGEETARAIRSGGGDSMFSRTDVSDSREVETLIIRTVDTYGRLDHGFNNAGIASSGNKIADVTEEEWDRILDVNLKGVFLCMKNEIRQMMKQGKGSIVNTSSAYGLTGQKRTAGYTSSKHGVSWLPLLQQHTKIGTNVLLLRRVQHFFVAGDERPQLKP